MFTGLFHDVMVFIQEYIVAFTELFLINLTLSMIIIFMERKKPTSTLLWVFAINFIPIFGFILYLILGQDLSKRKMFQEKKDIDKEIQAFAEHQLELMKSGDYTFDTPYVKEHMDMIEMFNRAEYEVLTEKNHVEILDDGPEKFEKLYQDIKKAKEAVYFQYYIFKSDKLGNRFIELFKEKAREGVEVLILIDGMGARNFRLKDRKALREAGVKVSIFFPGILPRINTHMNFRNHRKIVVIDHEIGYVGGFNVGEEYVNLDSKMGYWRDTHLRIIGPTVNYLQWRFFLDFRFASKEPVGGFQTKIQFSEEGDTSMCIVTSGPDSQTNSIRNGYDKIIMKARKDVYIQTPYFVPDDGLLYSLKIALMSGVKVHIMIPKTRDHPFVHWASLSFLGELLEYGADVYMYTGGFLHSKIVLGDDHLTGMGTANFDIRSFELNFEVNAFMFDKEITKKLVENFHKDVKESIKYTWEDYCNRSRWTKVRESISRLLAPVL
ncbi:MAG: cardiolipin synthase [Tissierellia bacterium]|nr:cardiolipin synthase [Tissierellia bacterium]